MQLNDLWPIRYVHIIHAHCNERPSHHAVCFLCAAALEVAGLCMLEMYSLLCTVVLHTMGAFAAEFSRVCRGTIIAVEIVHHI